MHKFMQDIFCDLICSVYIIPVFDIVFSERVVKEEEGEEELDNNNTHTH